MRTLPAQLLVLAVIFLPLTAKADSVDNFVLTNTFGDTISFSLPASPPLFGPDNPYLFETFPIKLSFKPPLFGNTILDGQIVFYSALSDGGLDVIIDHPGGPTSIIDNGDLLYSGTTIAPTFLIGTFNIGPDTLTITPQAAPVPELSSFILMGIGIFAFAAHSLWSRFAAIR
jgi:hypothetical protein